MSHEHRVAVERRRNTVLGDMAFIVLRQSCTCGARRHVVGTVDGRGDIVWRKHAWREGRSHG